MSLIKISGNASGTGTFEIAAPNSNTNRTQTLPDATGTVVLDSATQTLTNKTLTTPNINSAQFATVAGTAPIYPCRAWVNFNGTGTVAIRQSGNVTSITDNGTGDYTVNFTTAMADVNYASVTAPSSVSGNVARSVYRVNGSATTTSCQFGCATPSAMEDMSEVSITIFR